MEERNNMLHLAAQRAMAKDHSQSEILPISQPAQASQLQNQPKPSDKADDELLVEAINRLRVAFPDNSREFYGLLFNRLKEANMSRYLLIKKVNKVIDTYAYAKLTIGAIMNIDVNK